MAKSSRKPRSRKVSTRPAKPYPEYPLYAHSLGYWSAKVRGKILHFGRWGRMVKGQVTALPYEEGWTAALAVYKARVDDAKLGHIAESVVPAEGTRNQRLTVKELCDRFWTAKVRKHEAGEIGPRTLKEIDETNKRIVAAFGRDRAVEDLRPEDFEKLRAEIARKWGPVRLGNEITRIKSVFKYALDNDLISRPVRFGSEFKKPGKKTLRKSKAAKGGNMMEADELRRLLKAAPLPLRAMILLGLNCGFGPTDCATLPLDAVDLDGGFISYARVKTGIDRRCALWPETIEALREAIEQRPTPKQDAAESTVFVTARGRQWISGNTAWPVTAAMTALMKDVGVHRPGRGPYTMRHVFRTVADETPDRVAIDRIMGHSDNSMGGVYRERIADARLVAVAEHVRSWLFGGDADTTDNETESKSKRAEPAAVDNRGDDRPVILKLHVG